MQLKRYCYAKVNLFLRVLGKRADGFHELETLFHEIDLADLLEFQEDKSGALVLEAMGADVGSLEQNLVWKAAKAFEAAAHQKVSGQLILTKKIPAGGGLGGGSSDAANTLLLLNEHYGFPLGDEKLAQVALALGSDVPFFLKGGCQLGKGRGEILEPVPNPSPFGGGYVILPGIHMSTPTVFKAFALGEKPDCDGQPSLGENHLLGAALNAEPRFMQVYARLVQLFRGQKFFMTGSGSTCVWLTDEKLGAEREQALKDLKCTAIPFRFRDAL